MTFEELKALVLLNRMNRGGTYAIREMIREGICPCEVLGRIMAEDLSGKREMLRKVGSVFDPEREMERARNLGIEILTYFDDAYPISLKETADPPLLLYVRGSFLELDKAALAIVGARHASVYGFNQSRRFAFELAASGLTIVSGLARGIDQAAHEGALQVPGGRTIAVLGCGPDVIYPRGNAGLYEKISERGILTSEYALGTEPRAQNFPCRNRIISGLSLGVFVVEAHLRSGSLITAKEALDQGRDVFALPGPVDQLTSRGSHRLLKEGAYLADSPEDILEVLAPRLCLTLGGRAEDRRSETRVRTEDETPTVSERDPRQELPGRGQLLETLSREPLTFDEIMGKCALSFSSLSRLLVGLELERKILKSPEGRFTLSP